jgi:hypothetical protein
MVPVVIPIEVFVLYEKFHVVDESALKIMEASIC